MSDHDQQWQQFAQERARLCEALRDVTDGGIIDGIEHIGATSVPGLTIVTDAREACVDIGLAVWPFPVELHDRATLAALGYEPVSGYDGAPEQRFRHTAGGYQLFLAMSGSETWMDYLLIRDYLRNEPAARQAYQDYRREIAGREPAGATEAKASLFAALLPPARKGWIDRYGLAPLEAVVRELRELPCPWYVSSGWALDLFLGCVTRVHHDVDVVINRADQLILQQHLTARGWKFVTPFQKRLEPWPLLMRLESPRHQVHAHRDGGFIDFLLTDMTPEAWFYRREPSILRSASRMSLRTESGIAFLAPELVLLFKSKNTSATDPERSKDPLDFEQVCPHLDPERRAWLRWALLATNPAHPWIDRLL
jgi:GrpB-like predicted nucleotidyltransferase (UPF0157 family)